MKLNFNDISIKPCVTSFIHSQSQLIITYLDINTKQIHLPIITSPNNSIVSKSNIKDFIKNKIGVALPRDIDYEEDGEDRHDAFIFKSYSLNEFKEKFFPSHLDNDSHTYVPYKYLLIDTEDGHSIELFNTVKKFKDIYGDYYKLMVGNVINPETFKNLSIAGADYIRIGLNRNSCKYVINSGVSYPIVSLIKECKELKEKHKLESKIITDCEINDFSDIIKAISLGSDFVMIDEFFGNCLESSCKKTFCYIPFKNTKIIKILHDIGLPIYSNLKRNINRNIFNINTSMNSINIIKRKRVKYTIEQWVLTFSKYLSSAMRYTNSIDLSDFKKNSTFVKISNNSQKDNNK